MDILIEGLGTTLFSMGIVFLALIILSFCLDGLRLLVAVIERPVKQLPAADRRDAVKSIDLKSGVRDANKATDAIAANNSMSEVTSPAEKKQKKILGEESVPTEQIGKNDQDESQRVDPKIVAVLTAAVMAMEDGKRKYRLHAFQRIDQGPSPWVIAGRQDVMQGYWPK